MAAIDRTDHEYELRCETIDADGQVCLECHEVGPKDHLFVFSTVRGGKVRAHDGIFCSQQCHDRWHGVAPKRK